MKQNPDQHIDTYYFVLQNIGKVFRQFLWIDHLYISIGYLC